MRFRNTWRLRLGMIAICAVAALPCFADEVAVLRNGFSIRHERREVVGDITRLYVNGDESSYVDVPTAEIEHFEAAPAGTLAPGLQKPAAPPSAKSVRPSQPGRTSQPDLTEVVNSASGRYRLDPDLVASVIKAESGFNTHAISPKGAKGLMQLMPGTASQLGVPNAFDPQANVEGGTKYLRELLERYNFDLLKALAAYNAGPKRVEQYGGVPPYSETRAYVSRIVRDFNKKKIAQREAAEKAAAVKKAAAKAKASVAGTKSSATLVQASSSQSSE